MYVIEERYKINRIILKTLGLWPYQQSYFTQIHKVLFASILLTFILAQLLVFITTQYNTDLLFTILSVVFPVLFATVKYFLFIVETNSLKQLMEQIRNDWNSLKDKLEIDIIEKYASNMRLFTISAIAFGYIGVFLFGILQRLPLILDIISPLNESRPYQLFAIMEYFVSQDKYIQVMLLHEFLVCCIGMITIYGTGTTIMTYVTHLCALLKIASYRIENAIERNILAIPNPEKKYLLHQKIVHAVVIHQRAAEFNEFMTSVFLIPFAILIVVGISSLTCNLYLFFQLITSNNISKAFMIVILILAHLTYLFVANYCGQIVLNNGVDLFKAIYNGLWYAAPLSTQKLLLFIMQRGSVNLNISCFSIFVASLDGFASLTSTAVSYFTVIYSTR
ncbi:uncharacterized protein [Temnothorax nylanderi]|uniref:uncharacterized protein n=1 Tax=Temnothorax nylanderi TaxID=102681 RepID=UPI003A8BC40D